MSHSHAGFSSLRFRLSLAMCGVVMLCTAVCVITAVLFLNQTLTDKENRELHRTLTGVSGYIDNQRSDLLGTTRLVADDPLVAGAVQAEDRQALVLHLTPIYADLNAEIMDVIDARGRVVVRMEDTLSPRTWVAGRPSIGSALSGTPVVALEQDLPNQAAGGYALRATVPVRGRSGIIGAVVLGRRLDTIFAQRIGHALDASVNLIGGGQRTGSTLTDQHGLPVTDVPEPKAVLNRIATGQISVDTVHQNGHTQLSGVVPLQGPDGSFDGAVEVVRPLDPVYNVIKLLSFLLLALGLVVIFAGSILTSGIARRLTGRLLVLEATASSVASMTDSDVRLSQIQVGVPVQGSDEVASLARSLSRMMVALDQRLETNRELYGAARARVRELTGLAEIARMLNADPSIHETMDVLGEHVCRLVGVDGVAIWLPGEGSLPALRGGHGLPSGYEAMSSGMLSHFHGTGFETVAQEAMRTGEVSFRRLRDDNDVLHGTRQQLIEAMEANGWKSATAVPLRIQSRLVGALTCYTTADVPLGESDLGLLVTIADQVAVVIENARLAAEAQAKAALEERLQAQVHLREKEAQYRGVFEATSDGLVITETASGTIVEANPAYCRMHGYTHDEVIGLNARQVVHSSRHPDVDTLWETIDKGGELRMQGLNVRKDGSVFPTEIHGTSIIYNGKPHILAVLRDVTERVRAYELLEQRVEERTRELSSLLEVSRTVGSTLELQPLLNLILDQIGMVADNQDAAIVEWKDMVLHPIGYRGPIPLDDILGIRMPLDVGSPTWQVVNERRSLIIPDIRAATLDAAAFRHALGDLVESSMAHVTSWMAIPLVLRDRVLGIVTLGNSQPNFYTERHATLVLAVANQAAVAIENARLYQQAQEVAVLEERQRLARELHDSVSQALYGIALGTKTARNLLEVDPARVAEPLDYVLTLAEAGLSEMRALIFELRPEALDVEGLVAALEKQASAVRDRHRLKVETSMIEEPTLPLVTKEALFRIAQEALHNTVKHARASTVSLGLHVEPDGIVLVVSDDGLGFDTGASFPGHLGLETMRERATRLGGWLDVQSKPGIGTRIKVYVPASVVSAA